MWTTIKQIIKGYYQWFKFQLNKEYREKMEKEAERRIKICESCELFYKPARNCMICGCFCDIKTKGDYDYDDEHISIDGCPERKW
jgi:translation initiation factor IF-2